MTVPADTLLDVRGAAEFLTVAPSTVYLWVESGRLPYLRLAGTRIRFLRSDLEHWLHSARRDVKNGAAR